MVKRMVLITSDSVLGLGLSTTYTPNHRLVNTSDNSTPEFFRLFRGSRVLLLLSLDVLFSIRDLKICSGVFIGSECGQCISLTSRRQLWSARGASPHHCHVRATRENAANPCVA